MSSWKVNPASGDYVMENGAPVPTERLNEPAFYRVAVRRGQWLHAPDSSYGSDFHLVKKRFNGRDVSPLKNIAERAVQPLLDDGRARDIAVEYTNQQTSNRNAASGSIHILDNQGQVTTVVLPPIGG